MMQAQEDGQSYVLLLEDSVAFPASVGLIALDFSLAEYPKSHCTLRIMALPWGSFRIF